MGVFGVIGDFRNGQIVHEEMGSRLRKNKNKLFVLGVKKGGFATPDHSEIDVSIF